MSSPERDTGFPRPGELDNELRERLDDTSGSAGTAPIEVLAGAGTRGAVPASAQDALRRASRQVLTAGGGPGDGASGGVTERPVPGDCDAGDGPMFVRGG